MNVTFNNFFQTIFILTISLIISACGGGTSSDLPNGGGNVPAVVTTPPPTDTTPTDTTPTDTTPTDTTPTDTTPITDSILRFSWSQVNDARITGYRIYYSNNSLSNGGALGYIDVDNSNSYIEFNTANYDLGSATHIYMAVMAIGSDGLRSPLSQEVSIAL